MDTWRVEPEMEANTVETRASTLPYEDFLRNMLGESDPCETLASLLQFCKFCQKWCFDGRNCHECGKQLGASKAQPNVYSCIIYRSGDAKWLSPPFTIEREGPPDPPQTQVSTSTPKTEVGLHYSSRALHYSSPLPHTLPAPSAVDGHAMFRCVLCSEVVPDGEAHISECPDERIRVQATPNVLTSFIYGLETLNGQPLKLDVRYEDEKFILIDDPLNICMFHANCVPTTTFIPDWRTLLTNPAKGLALIDRMVTIGFQAILTAWEDERWRGLISPNERDFFSANDIRMCMIAGFAIPSNQRQLSLQVLCPPFTPLNYHRLVAQQEFAFKQWFPLEYVCKILTLCVRRGIQLTMEDVNMPVDALIAFFDDIPYDSIHTKALQRYGRAHRQLAHFPVEMFAFIVGDDRIVPTHQQQELAPDRDTLRERDRKIFTPKGSASKFYGYPKEYPLPHWGA